MKATKKNTMDTIVSVMTDGVNGQYFNTGGIDSDMDGKCMRVWLESCGVPTILNCDNGFGGMVLCVGKLRVSDNGYCYTC